MLALKQAEINSGGIPVHMQQGYKETKQIKYKYETPTVMVHTVNISETTTLWLPTEDERGRLYQGIVILDKLRIFYLIQSKQQVTPNSREKKGYIKPFQKRLLEFHNGLILYYNTPRTYIVRKLRLRVVPGKFI